MKNSARIFVVCFVGACIGTFVALEIHPLFWWVGTLVGAGIAYFGFNLKEVGVAMKTAFRRTVAWRHNTVYWIYWREGFVFAMNIWSTILAGMILVFLFFTSCGLGVTNVTTFIFSAEYVLINASVILSCVAFCVIFSFLNAFDYASKRNGMKGPYTFPNVIRVYFWIVPRAIFTGLMWLVKQSPKGVEKIVLFVVWAKSFFVTFFLLIHSELRLLCAVDAALGTAIGYFAGSILIGAIAGGVLGVVNYEVVSVRVLKLAECKSMFK